MQRKKALQRRRPIGGLEKVNSRKKASKKSKSPSKESGSKKKSKRKSQYQVPPWFKSLPSQANHGSNKEQRKLWRLVSETVRLRDYKKGCVSCGRYFDSWKDAQCGHYRAWSICNGMFKFNLKVLAAQCAHCNMVSDGVIGHRFTETMKERYGDDYPEWVIAENLKHKGEKLDLPTIVAYAEEVLEEKKTYQQMDD